MEYTAITQLPAIDIARARAWYKETLGLDPVRAGGDRFDAELFDAEPSNFGLDYDTGSAQFSIYETQHAGKNLATAMRLVTEDFDALHTHLLSKGVVFEIYDIEENFHDPDGTPYFDNGALISPDGEKTAWFKDSENNIIAIGSSWG